MWKTDSKVKLVRPLLNLATKQTAQSVHYREGMTKISTTCVISPLATVTWQVIIIFTIIISQ